MLERHDLSIKHKLPMNLIYVEVYSSSTLTRKREIALKKKSYLKEELYQRIFEAPSSNG